MAKQVIKARAKGLAAIKKGKIRARIGKRKA